MRMTDENAFGIYWAAVDLEEGWEEEDESGTTHVSIPLKNHPAGHFQASRCLDHDHAREAETDLRKVTVYLPYALFRKMHQYKKRKRIRSYSEAITSALTSYLE